MQHPPCFVSIPIENEDTGTKVTAAEFGPAGMYRTDTFVGCPLPQEGAGGGFLLLLLLIKEEYPFIRVHGNDTLLTIGVPYPEFVRTNLLLYADDLSHGTTAVTAALAYKCHNWSSFSVV